MTTSPEKSVSSTRCPSIRLAGIAAVWLATHAAGAQTFELLHTFAANGYDGRGPLITLLSGVLYGTTTDGGAFNRGSVYAVTPLGGGYFTFQTIHSFVGPDGEQPAGRLISPDGDLYGATLTGGSTGSGTLFRLTASGDYTRLHDFTGADGQTPSGLVAGPDGALYGTTTTGGASGAGTVFRIDADGHFSLLHSFDGAAGGGQPRGELVPAGGVLWGTTSLGGAQGLGTAFRIDLAGNLMTIHDFGGIEGAAPAAALIQSVDGYLYGTTSSGGAAGGGTIFRMDGAGNVTVLHALNGADGYDSEAPLFEYGNGQFWGVARGGGSGGGKDQFPAGTLFHVDAAGNFSVFYEFVDGFAGNGGGPPLSPLADGRDGFLYATRPGLVYRINPNGFPGTVGIVSGFPSLEPSTPHTPLTEADGAFYGIAGPYGSFGQIYRFDGSAATVVHAFSFDQSEGYTAVAALLLASDGALYGVNQGGGSAGGGTAYRLTLPDVFEKLHDFGGAEGRYPAGELLEVSDGSFYGTTVGDNSSTFGTVYAMDATGAASPLHTFVGADGSGPFDGLVRASDGSFYGTTLYGGDNAAGTIFSIDSMGSFTKLHSFDGTDGSTPYASPIQASDGELYGVTSAGGGAGGGTVYRFDGSTVTTLHDFTGSGDGAFPSGRLLEDSDGLIYGTTSGGGPGTIFRVDPAGGFATVHTFSGNDGSTPTARLTEGSDGALYGTANYGGNDGLGNGTVFRLVPGAPPPSLTGISPSSGPAAGVKRVAISGVHLWGASAVSFGGVAAAPFAVADQGTIYAISPALPAGTLSDVVVDVPPAGNRPDSTILPAAWFADFSDVAQDDLVHSYVESIFRNGITAGCGGGFYCRDSAVTRAQMAVFLLKAEHGSGYTPPACAGTFPDVPCPSLFADWIEQLAIEGITGGCGGGNYCPGNPVTRRQMAVFLLKASLGSGYTPPPAVGFFDDVPAGDTFAPWIEDLYNRQITGGCQVLPALYCPGNPVTRGQMAVFLDKTFGLP